MKIGFIRDSLGPNIATSLDPTKPFIDVLESPASPCQNVHDFPGLWSDGGAKGLQRLRVEALCHAVVGCGYNLKIAAQKFICEVE